MESRDKMAERRYEEQKKTEWGVLTVYRDGRRGRDTNFADASFLGTPWKVVEQHLSLELSLHCNPPPAPRDVG